MMTCLFSICALYRMESMHKGLRLHFRSAGISDRQRSDLIHNRGFINRN